MSDARTYDLRTCYVLHVGVTPFKMVTVVGIGLLTGVPPEASVMMTPPTVMEVVVVGIGMLVVDPPMTNVSDFAVEGGYGLGSMEKYNVNYRPTSETNDWPLTPGNV